MREEEPAKNEDQLIANLVVLKIIVRHVEKNRRGQGQDHLGSKEIGRHGNWLCMRADSSYAKRPETATTRRQGQPSRKRRGSSRRAQRRTAPGARPPRTRKTH